MVRLERFLTQSGRYSRREWKQWLRTGRVCCNGQPVRDGSMQVDPERDCITFDGERLNGPRRLVLLLHKPAGYVTATEDADAPTVMELLPEPYRTMPLRPVGRLDKATEGLLLLTNDGELLHRLISPRHGVEKQYYAEHEGAAGRADIAAFAGGLTLRDGTVCRPAVLTPLGPGRSRITVTEGKYHQVRRMMAACGMPVTYLRREREGSLALGALPLGQTRLLTDREVSALLEPAAAVSSR